MKTAWLAPSTGSRAIAYEQAVYGSFAFRSSGYGLLARSSGCRPEWIRALTTLARHYGERPPGAVGGPGLCALPADASTWMIVGVSDQGLDDQGRPGALGFHAIFLSKRDYRAGGAQPLDWVPVLRAEWDSEVETLSAGRFLPTAELEVMEAGPEVDTASVERIVEALGRRRRVALEASGPIDELARAVWQRLPLKMRSRATLATWAFAADSRFDLLAVPRLSAVTLDRSYVTPATWNTGSPRRRLVISRSFRVVLAAVPLIGLMGWGIRSQFADPTPDSPSLPTVSSVPDPEATSGADVPPPVLARDATPLDPSERDGVVEALANLAERFDVGTHQTETRPDPADLMQRFAERLRYPGPWLDVVALERLRARDDAESRRVLAWHEHLKRFAPDRKLPEGFETAGLRSQLEALAWSFRLDEDPRRTPREMVLALGDALAREGPARPPDIDDPAIAPTLRAYARFLASLPQN